MLEPVPIIKTSSPQLKCLYLSQGYVKPKQKAPITQLYYTRFVILVMLVSIHNIMLHLTFPLTRRLIVETLCTDSYS